MSNQPYAGLRPFQREETELFFGREQHTDELLTRLAQQHFLAVIGVSGCGKSSLVKAGLIPSLEAGFLNQAGTHWKIAQMRPSNQPFKNLAEALIDQALGENYRTALMQNNFLKRGAFSLHELLAIQPVEKQAKLLIVCDQFEELFRYYDQGSKAEAEAFVALLLASSKAFNSPDNRISNDIYIVLTMRSDFLGDCALFSGLAEAINTGLYLTPRLNRQQLRMAIEEPALVFGGKVESELTVQLLEDAGNNQDQLPLLQHALMLMWQLVEKSNRKHLTLLHYTHIGNLKNSLSNHADKIYNHLTKEQKQIAEIMFRNLTERGDAQRDTRRPVQLIEIITLTGASFAEVVAVVDEFRQTGRCFLMPPIESEKKLLINSVIDISHESLIRQWKKLKEWTDDEAENAKIYQRLEDRALEWEKGKGSLLQSGELENFQQWWTKNKINSVWAKRYGKDFALTQNFFTVSKKLLKKQLDINLRRNLLLIIFTGLFILISVSIVIIRQQYNIVNLEKIQVKKQREKAVSDIQLAKENAVSEFQQSEAVMLETDNAKEQKIEELRQQIEKVTQEREDALKRVELLQSLEQKSILDKNYSIYNRKDALEFASKADDSFREAFNQKPLDIDKLDKAFALYHISLKIQSLLSNNSNTKLDDLSVLNEKIGLVYNKMGLPEKSSEFYEEQTRIDKELLELDSHNKKVLERLLNGLQQLVTIYNQLGNTEKAHVHFMEIEHYKIK